MSVRELYTANNSNLYAHDLNLSGDLNMDGDINLDDVKCHTVTADSTIASTSISTGAIACLGGVGITGNTRIGGALYAQSTAASIDLNSGAIQCSGGVAISERLNVGGAIYAVGDATISGTCYAGGVLTAGITTDSDSVTVGSLIVNGGVGIAKKLNVGSALFVHSTDESYDISTGSLVCEGGVAVSKRLSVGTDINVTNNTTITGTCYVGGVLTAKSSVESVSTSVGALTVSGGVGVAKNLHVGGTITLPATGYDLVVSPTGWFAGDSVHIVIQKVGSVANFSIPNLSGTANTTNYITIAGNPVPPSANVSFPLLVSDDSILYIGYIEFQTSGYITISMSTTVYTFTDTKAVRVFASTFSYPI